ncbi:hypothetical protein PoB_001321400 [Plakobranchus ocellatus]|uniref:Uncharacterized protein n=1 Tax=Plakobranchus ocellatus TaxID=259542 RepID=A0AAV3YY92_9GAST|nr:hypothetical protein PoB_001321400 [Plakobranchus ocellatus]
MSSRVVDLEAIVNEWAWLQFKVAREKEWKDLKQRDLCFDIKWDQVIFATENPQFYEKYQLEKPESQVVFQGQNLNVKLGTPYDILSTTAGFGREINMQKSRESEHEVVLTWSVNTNVQVPPRHRTIAQMFIKEQQFSATFKMIARITGIVVVYVLNRKNNDAFLMTVENDMVEVVRGALPNDGSHFEVEDKTLVWQLVGDCNFRFGVEQNVLLTEEALDDEGAGMSTH